MKTLTYAEAHRLFDYEPTTGLLTWRISKGPRAKAGSLAGSINGDGYLTVGVDGKTYQAHRVVWLLMTGTFPENEVDHINGIPADNRWSNLRAATHVENCWNTKKHDDNSSGYKGVYWNKHHQKWHAQIKVFGTNYFLGYYSTPEDAAQSYIGAAALAFGEFQRQHPNHHHH